MGVAVDVGVGGGVGDLVGRGVLDGRDVGVANSSVIEGLGNMLRVGVGADEQAVNPPTISICTTMIFQVLFVV